MSLAMLRLRWTAPILVALTALAACRSPGSIHPGDIESHAKSNAPASKDVGKPAEDHAAPHASDANASATHATDEANRDKHGNPDIAKYIETLQSDKRVAELRVDVVLEKLALPP